MEDGTFVCHLYLEDTDCYNWTTASMSDHCSSHTSYTWWWQNWRGWDPSPSLSDTEESRAVYWLVGVVFIIVCVETPDDYDDTIVEDEDHPEDRQAAWWLDWSNIVTETPDDDATDDTTKEDGDLTDRQWLWCSLCHHCCDQMRQCLCVPIPETHRHMLDTCIETLDTLYTGPVAHLMSQLQLSWDFTDFVSDRSDQN